MWSLRPWPVVVRLGNQEMVIPALPAADWLAVLMQEDLWPEDVFPGLCGPAVVDLVDELVNSGEVNLDDLADVSLDVLEAAASRSWWVALRLITVCRQNWATIGAELLLDGVDASRLSLSGWLDVATLVIMRRIKPESALMFTSQLEAPPAGEEAVEVQAISAQEFLSMA